MAAITLPNIGLKAGYPEGDNTWGADMNRNLRILDALANMRVLDKDLTTPPGSPTAGETYIVATGATGAWAGQDGKLAIWGVGDDLLTPAWFFVTPKSGWRTYVVDEDERYQYGTSWTLVVDGGGGGTGIVESIVAGAGISVDNADPANPSVSWKAPTVVAEAGTSLLATAANAGRYTRFTAASAKTYTFNSTETYTMDDEYHVRNAGAGDLTITSSGSFVLNAPSDGTLVVPQGGTATVKIVGAAEADVFGVTVAP